MESDSVATLDNFQKRLISHIRGMIMEINDVNDEYEGISSVVPNNTVVIASTSRLPSGETELKPMDRTNRILHHLELIYDQPVRHSFKHIRTSHNKALASFLGARIKESHPLSVIVGPPGIGKTTEAASMLMQCAVRFPDMEFLWIPVNRFLFGGYCFKLQNGKITEMSEARFFKSEGHTQEDYTTYIISAKTIMIIYDGVNKTNYLTWKSIIANQLIQAKLKFDHLPLCFIVSSMSLTQAYKVILSIPIKEFHMKPWSREDFRTAVQENDLFEAVKKYFDRDDAWIDTPDSRITLVDEKFQIAGTCSRWMFDKTTGELVELIDSLIDGLPSTMVWESMGERSSHCVYQLFHTVDHRLVPTSSYVLRRLLRKGKDFVDNFLRTSYRAKKSLNAALDDWIFELDFLTCVTRGIESRSIGNRFRLVVDGFEVEDGHFWVSKYQYFHSTAKFDLNASSIQFMDYVWYIPEIYCQGGFDLAQLLEADMKIRFFQLTRAEKHKMKLEYMISFLENINLLRAQRGLEVITTIEIITIVPKPKVTLFTLGETTGLPRNDEIKLSNDVKAKLKCSFHLATFL